MKNKKPSQANKILAFMKSGKSITALQALNRYGCFRLAARIHELTTRGIKIKRTTINRKGKSFSSYALAK